MDISVQIPELLLQEVRELASQQNASVDQIVSAALVAQVSAWRMRESVASRAGRVNWQQVDEILVRVPDVPPPDRDKRQTNPVS